MALAANSSIKLDIHSPKKDAVVATPGTAAGATEIRIWAAADIDPGATQSIVGTFWVLFRWAKSNMHLLTGSPAVVHVPLGGSEAQVELNGIPASDECRLEVGSGVHGGDKSHFLDRTFKRCIEAYVEATSKNSGVGAASGGAGGGGGPGPEPEPPYTGTVVEGPENQYQFSGLFRGEQRFVVATQLTGQQQVNTTITLPPNPNGWSTEQTVAYLRAEIDSIPGVDALATSDRIIIAASDLSEPFYSAIGML